MKIDFTKLKENIPVLISSALILIVFIFSLVFYLVKKDSVKRVFIFPSVESGIQIVETRFLPENPHQGKIQLYIDELLLGSQTERTKNLFASGTKVNSCFVRKGVLYLDLSDDVILMGEGVIPVREAFDLLKENIYKNFKEIKKILIFVNGNAAYEEQDFSD